MGNSAAQEYDWLCTKQEDIIFLISLGSPESFTIFGATAATLLCSLGQRCTYVNSIHSTNVTPTISQRCLIHQPTLSQPSANATPTISQHCSNQQPTLPQPSPNVVPTIRQYYPNHQPMLSQPSAKVAPTIFQCVLNLQKTNIFLIKILILFQICFTM